MSQRAFTLLEVLVTIGMIALLTTLAYPAYIHHITRSRRQIAKISLLDCAGKLESYYLKHGSYKGATLQTLHTKDISTHYYRLQIAYAHKHDFLIKAIPFGTQAQHDTRCGTLSVNEYGEYFVSGSGVVNSCW